jgi:hypothetical protein
MTRPKHAVNIPRIEGRESHGAVAVPLSAAQKRAIAEGGELRVNGAFTTKDKLEGVWITVKRKSLKG